VANAGYVVSSTAVGMSGIHSFIYFIHVLGPEKLKRDQFSKADHVVFVQAHGNRTSNTILTTIMQTNRLKQLTVFTSSFRYS